MATARHRRTAAAAGTLAAAALLAACSGSGTSGAPPATTDAPRPTSTATPTPAASPTPAVTPDPGPRSERRTLRKVTRLTGGLTPKSVVASPDGTVVAQNMMYTHTVSVYGPDHELVTTVQDRVVPSEFGYRKWTRALRGGPVEASFSPDGRYVWVSNYAMYGPGFDDPGDDVCSPSNGFDRSFLYRIDTRTWEIDGIVLVGAVPKYVQTTPDGRHVLITNWCSYDLSVVDATTLKETARIPVGRYPRGIAVSPDGSRAYVAVMGGGHVAAVDLEAVAAGRRGKSVVSRFAEPGSGPRHLNLSPDGRTLYVTLNGDGRVVKLSARTGKVLGRVATGKAPRSAALSPDGTVLYVVNYESDTMSRVRTRDMVELDEHPVDHHPIGITYNTKTDEVWVCSYAGAITVFADAPRK